MSKNIKLGVPRRVLLFLASLVWAIAGFNILKIAIEELLIIENMQIIGIIGGIIGFLLFFKFVFFKMYKKHTSRIINIENERPCIFSFFDRKGYMIMIFMITLGISLRGFNLIGGIPLVMLYLSIGLSLSSASIAFLLAFVNYEKSVGKYKIN